MLAELTKFTQRLSIRLWLLLLVLVFALPAVVGIAWYAVNTREVARRDAYDNVKIVVDNVASNLDLILRDHERLLISIASEYQGDPPVKAPGFNPDQVRVHNGLIVNLGVRDLQANPIYFSGIEPAPAAKALQFPWVQEALHSEQFAVSGAFLGEHSGRWVIVLTYPVRDLNGKRTGFVNLALDLQSLNARVLGSVPSNVIVPVFDHDNRFLLRSAGATEWIGKPLPEKLAEAVRGVYSGFVIRNDLKGISRFYAITTVPSVGWRVFAGLPEAEVLAPAQKKFRNFLIAGITLLLGLAAIALKMAHSIAQPVRDLAETAKKIASGNDESRAHASGPVEIGAVAQEFNRMLDTLNSAKQALQEREFLLAESQRIGHIGSYTMDVESDHWTSSAVLDQIFGLAPGGRRSTASWNELVHPDERAAMLQYFVHDVIEKRKPFDREYRIVRASDGTVRWVWGLGELSFNSDGMPTRMIGTIQDITERKLAQGKLELAANVFTHAREGITITDAQGTIIDVNDTFTRITGYSRAEVIGQSPRLLKSGRQSPEFYVEMWQALTEKNHWYGEVWNRRKNGEIYPQSLTISAVLDPNGITANYVGLFSDITALKEHQDKLEHIAHFDALTGLPNRVLLADRLQQAMAQCKRRNKSLAVIYIDLDGFKTINDRHSHTVGDKLLIELAERMSATLRDGDTLSRFGGDEFVGILIDFDQSGEHELVLQRLLQAAASEVTVEDQTLQVSASIGVTFYPQDEVDADVLIRHADHAMYIAKQAGKNRAQLFDVAQDTQTQTDLGKLTDIRDALSNNQFVLFYQPKVDLGSGRLIGAEALIRWQHPELGLLVPDAFLPLIEDHPLSVELGKWVVSTALAQMRVWQQSGIDIPVSVNVGARQLQDASFPQDLQESLSVHADVSPAKLQLEILETTALEDVVKISEVMGTCLRLGVEFQLDDFGTGYSSLTYLKGLPVQTLKIDQSFVRGMLNDPNDLAIVTGVIGLAKAFGKRVIAEGVETHAHAEMLLSLGCTMAQGYGIARPMPPSELPGWIADWHSKARWKA